MKKMIFILTLLMFMVLTGAEKERLAIMDMQDNEKIFSSVTGEKVTDCLHCHVQDRETYTIPMLQRSSSSGGSSGSSGSSGGSSWGGGSSGGGGAGSKW